LVSQHACSGNHSKLTRQSETSMRRLATPSAIQIHEATLTFHDVARQDITA